MIINSEKELLDYVSALASNKNLDAIVVEGYDGVGKGRVLTQLSELLEVTPYRPDYNLWQQYDHRIIDRWKVSGFFWDVYSHFHRSNSEIGMEFCKHDIMLFDRGVISGAVYGDDDTIARNYKTLLRDMTVLHILVSCDKEDYIEFQKSRNPNITPEELETLWKKCEKYTEKFDATLKLAHVNYLIYKNRFVEDIASQVANTCAGCGHYNYGWCRHPRCNFKVDGNNLRCEYSKDKEVQDKYDAEVYRV